MSRIIKYLSRDGGQETAEDTIALAPNSKSDKLGNEENSYMLEERDQETIVDVEEEPWINTNDFKMINYDEWSLRPCLLIAGCLILAWVAAVVIYYSTGGKKDDSKSPDPSRRITFEDSVSGVFVPSSKELEWSTTSAEDGVFTYRDQEDNIVLEHIADGSKKIIVNGKDIVDPYGETISYFSYSMSPDSLYMLLATNRTKQWRYSYYANYWIYNLTSKSVFPLTAEIDTMVAYAEWGPRGHNVAFVKSNDLYISVNLSEERRVTFDGTPNIFNGIPDWIYEEEVLTGNSALWWSPEGTRITYLRLNETNVPEYRFPLYRKNPMKDSYTEEVVMKYPKPGYPNPLVSLHIYDLHSPMTIQSEAIPFKNDFDVDDRIITQVVWVGQDRILIREMNRVQDIQRTVLVNVLSRKGTTVREENAEQEDGGWFEVTPSIVNIPQSKKREKDAYIDLVHRNGYNHLAIFSPLDSDKPQWITGGDWEVVKAASTVDLDQEIVYYISTEKSSIERHLYSIRFDGTNKTALTPIDKPGYYSVDFSPGKKYYHLKYKGPDVPWQKVLKVGDPKFENVIEKNDLLRQLIANKDLPDIRRFTIQSGGIEMNAMEIRPPLMDDSGQKKYPVLFRVYGGPCSQMVTQRFAIDWHTYLASSLDHEYIIVLVDGRGTGFKGRQFRVGVRNQLGKLEAHDVVNAGRWWCRQKYVDCERLGIWGWSYGGYLTSKVIETNSKVFKLGIAVAPVTDWKFYDSIYTERYLKTPSLNPDGYRNSAVSNMTGFENANFLLIHGTGDDILINLAPFSTVITDNVHFQNSAVLVDRLTLASIHNYQVQYYTDSDHSIRNNNANPELFFRMTEYLEKNFKLN
ncbi:hypothetical protein G9A89_008324 [Geosiphon pyriformis]|nr:hypothetical protein G9A89_008324 [Geosiphon pyriformis]